MKKSQIKKILISANQNDFLMKSILKKLKATTNLQILCHDPTSDSLNLSELPELIRDIDLMIVKAAGESSIDLLYFASINNIPTLNKFESVAICKNKIDLDIKLRTIFSNYRKELKIFSLPKAWLHPSPLRGLQQFKKWAALRLPLVFKSHDQHNEFFRFNFLALNSQEIDDFILNYKDFLYFDLYIQEFIECDGFDRKIYVCGDEIFGIKRENPIYIYLRDKPESIDVKSIERKHFEVKPEIRKLAEILAGELDLDIFGFDLVKSHENQEVKFFLIDLNDFPGFQGIEQADKIIAEYIIKHINKM